MTGKAISQKEEADSRRDDLSIAKSSKPPSREKDPKSPQKK